MGGVKRGSIRWGGGGNEMHSTIAFQMSRFFLLHNATVASVLCQAWPWSAMLTKVILLRELPILSNSCYNRKCLFDPHM